MNVITLNLLIAAIALVLTIIFGLILKKNENVLDWVYSFFRNFLGTFFIFSGTVKAIDPTGTAIKMGDYFAVFSEYAPMLDPLWNFSLDFALPIATVLIIIEILLGITLIFGLFKKPTLWLYAGLLIFFLFLTGFTTITGKVTDCGCFGDFLKLKPKVSFFKDILLAVVFIIVVLFAKRKLKPLFNPKFALAFFAIATIFTVWFNLRNINHLPIKDFRAYKVGTNLNKCTSMEGLEEGERELYYTMKNSKTGETKELESKEYMSSGIWKNKNWTIVEGANREVIIKEAELPPCKDFIIIDADGNEIQDDIKNLNGIQFLVGAYDLSKSNSTGFNIVNKTLNAASNAGIPIMGLTSSSIQKGNKMARGYQFSNLDAVPIKTMIRSNPGVVMLKDGTVIAKWHYNDIPSFADIKKEFKF